MKDEEKEKTLKEKSFKAVIGKLIMYQGSISMIAVEDKRQWDDITEVMKANYQPKFL